MNKLLIKSVLLVSSVLAVSGCGSGAGTSPVLEVPKYSAPNTSWETKTFTHSGISAIYEFGKGNPASVSLTADEVKSYALQCDNGIDAVEARGKAFCIEGKSYMLPEIEVALKDVLSRPEWTQMVEQCYDEYANSQIGNLYERFQTDILEAHTLDLEKLLYIDKESGRKELDTGKIHQVVYTIMAASNISEVDGKPQNPCMGKFGVPLMYALEKVKTDYLRILANAVQS